jgi:hypothetical protein
MTKFEKVKNATTKSIRFLSSSRRDSIVFLILLIVWTCLLCLVKKPDHQSDTEIICNDERYINHPMASRERIVWKQICLIFGLAWSCFNFATIEILHGLAGRQKKTALLKFTYRALLCVASILTGSFLVWLWGNNLYYTETRLAPNFLAVCRPLDLFCSPDSIVRVKCTTPAEMWMPALSDSLPTLAAIQAYLMVIASVKMAHCVLLAVDKLDVKSIILGLITLVINVVLTLATACLIITCNNASVNIDFVSGYIKSFIVACFWLVGEYYWRLSGIEGPTLPRYWNDEELGDEEAIPGSDQLPTNPTPWTTAGNDPTAQSGQIPTNPTPSFFLRETENAYQTIYPKLPEYPPSYEDSVIRY